MNGRAGTPVDRYPGPGEYCPECGAFLDEAVTPSPVATAVPTALPTVKADTGPVQPPPHTPLVTPPPAFQREESVAPTASGAPAQPQRRIVFGALAALAAVVAAIAVIRPVAIGGPRPGGTVHICRSSMTERFAFDVIHAYAEKTRTPSSRFELSNTDCDVRFAAATARSSSGLVGHDGVVVIVNPQNRIGQLSERQLRMVFTGEISDWSELGGSPGRILPLLTADSSDEVRTLTAGLLRGRELSAAIHRLPSSADVVRTVTSAHGAGTIGLVAFSAAVPGKVVKLQALPVPSVLSIGEHRYPLTVAVTVDSQRSSHDATPSALVQFARSEDAQAIAMRDGIIPRKGF